MPIIIDNSASISDLKANKIAMKVFKKLSENNDLLDKFDVQTYQFDSDFLPADTIDFKGKQSNIDIVAKNLKNIYKILKKTENYMKYFWKNHWEFQMILFILLLLKIFTGQ